MARVRRNRKNVTWRLSTYTDAVERSRNGVFNKFHLSNIGDWMSREEFAGLLNSIKKKAEVPAKIFARYIHLNHEIPEELKNCFILNHGLAEELGKKDRYPFYGLVPLDIRMN